jgi:cobalamin biosynthesis protein CobT
MFLSKREALTVAKLLAIHNNSVLCSGTSDLQRECDALKDRVEQFLTGERVGLEDDEDEWPAASSSAIDYGTCNDHDCEDCGEEEEDEESDDETAEDDDEEEEDSSSEEDEEDDEGEGEGEESSEEDDEDDGEDEDLDTDFVVATIDLVDVLKLKTEQGTLTFEEDAVGVNLVRDGDEVEMRDVTHMKRFGKELHVRDSEAQWEVYDVKRFPKAWTELLPLEQLVEVE